jgi:tetratricopeptide (TPR) repeat protein
MEHYKKYEMQSQIAGFRKSLDHDPDNPFLQEGLATYLFGLGKPAEAVSVLEHRLKTSQPSIFSVVSLGMCLVASGDHRRAESELRRALAMDREYPLAWLGLGKTLAAQSSFEQAEQAFRRAYELAPALSDARINLADLLVRQGQLEQAAEVCLAAMKDSPIAADVCLKMAEIRARQRRYDDSLKYNEEARRLAPYTHPAKVLLAVNCFQNGDKQKAQALLREALDEAPDHPVAALMLGQLARQEREWETARNYLASAASKQIPDNWPESHRRRFLVLLHSERLQLAQQSQDIEMARALLVEWLKSDPENGQLKEMLNELNATVRQ